MSDTLAGTGALLRLTLRRDRVRLPIWIAGLGLTSASAGAMPYPGVRFVPIADETELARFSGIWSPHNRNPALMKFLALGNELARAEVRNLSAGTHRRRNEPDLSVDPYGAASSPPPM